MNEVVSLTCASRGHPPAEMRFTGQESGVIAVCPVCGNYVSAPTPSDPVLSVEQMRERMLAYGAHDSDDPAQCTACREYERWKTLRAALPVPPRETPPND